MTGEMLKLGSYYSYGSAILIFNYFGIDAEAFMILGILLYFDTVLGIAKSYVLFGENSNWFSSRKLKVGVISKIAMLLFVILFALAVKQWIGEDIISEIAVSTTLGLLIVAEFISIVQNIIMIKTGKEIQERDAVTLVLTQVLNILKKFIDNKVDHTDK